VKLRRPVTQTRNATICHLDARQWAPRNERFAGGRVGPSRPLWARASSVDRHTEHLSATICCADIDPRTASTSLDATNRGARLCCCSSPHVHTEMSNFRGTPPVHLRQNGNVARIRASLDRLQARSLCKQVVLRRFGRSYELHSCINALECNDWRSNENLKLSRDGAQPVLCNVSTCTEENSSPLSVLTILTRS